jgi:hypothetical protein
VVLEKAMTHFVAFVAAAALLAAAAPHALTLTSVFLFAGPHNWMEARFFLARLPSRWIVRRPFLPVALGGVLVLGGLSIAGLVSSAWFSALGLWILLLTHLAGRDASVIAGPVLAGIALAWFDASLAGLALVFLHPVVALCFLYRQAGKRWPGRSRTPGVAAVCLLGAVVVCARWTAVEVEAIDVLPRNPALLGLHAYLELLHYGVWIAALPLLGLRAKPWDWRAIPLARTFGSAVRAALLTGLVIVALLWAAFLTDYTAARQVYFAIAVFHVLAEAPMLAWLR